jgi:hypothetical protein
MLAATTAADIIVSGLADAITTTDTVATVIATTIERGLEFHSTIVATRTRLGERSA